MTGSPKNNPDLQQLQDLQDDYSKIKKDLDALMLDTNKNPEEKEQEADKLIRKAKDKENKLRAEIERIKADQQANQAEKDAAEAADEFLQQTEQEVQKLYKDIIKSTQVASQTPAQTPTQTPAQTPAQTPTQTPNTNNDNFFTRAFNWIGGKFSDAGSWVGEQWEDVRDKNKWKDETGTNIARTVGFAATGIGVLGFIYRGIKNLFGGGKDSKESKGKEDEDDGKNSLLESAAARALKELTDKKSK